MRCIRGFSAASGTEKARFILPEISIAKHCRLPALLFADKEVLVNPPESLQTFDGEIVSLEGAIPVDMKGGGFNGETEKRIHEEIRYLQDQYRTPTNPYNVFFASDAKSVDDHARKWINRIVSSITGRGCVFARDFVGEGIDERLKSAVCVIADVTSSTAETWFYAGIAARFSSSGVAPFRLGSGAPVARGGQAAPLRVAVGAGGSRAQNRLPPSPSIHEPRSHLLSADRSGLTRLFLWAGSAARRVCPIRVHTPRGWSPTWAVINEYDLDFFPLRRGAH